jgi:hypothetical protein
MKGISVIAWIRTKSFGNNYFRSFGKCREAHIQLKRLIRITGLGMCSSPTSHLKIERDSVPKYYLRNTSR